MTPSEFLKGGPGGWLLTPESGFLSPRVEWSEAGRPLSGSTLEWDLLVEPTKRLVRTIFPAPGKSCDTLYVTQVGTSVTTQSVGADNVAARTLFDPR